MAMDRRSSKLAPQRPAKKTVLFRPTRSRNSYRRSRKNAATTRNWRGAVCLTFGFIAVASLCLGMVLLYHQVLTSSLFSIKDNRNIEIEGLHRLSPEFILQLAKLSPPINLLAVKPALVEHSLESHPWIARATVTRKWPHRLHLRIQEREPVALVQLGELYYVDQRGNLFKPLSPGDPHDFPVITGLKQEYFAQGNGALREPLAQVFGLVELLKKAQPPLNLENISEVHVDRERGFTLYANGLGAGVDLGLEDFPEKLTKFGRIWPILSQKGYLPRTGRINLDYPERVLVSLKGMETGP
jgi:cell division septal protein FtsQ